jgi:peptide deformylase
MILKIQENTRLLYKKTEKWDFTNPPVDTLEFSQAICELMWKDLAMGLAANQLGYDYRIFSIIGDPESFVCINPRIVDFSEEVLELEEFSPSYPGFVIEKTRPKHIRMRFAGPSSEVFTRKFTGMTARVIQIMMDHLDGRPFWDGISKLRFDMCVKKARKLGFDYTSLPYKPN